MKNEKPNICLTNLQAHVTRLEELVKRMDKSFSSYQDMVVRNTGYYHRRDIDVGELDPVDCFYNSTGRVGEVLKMARMDLNLLKEVIEDE